MNPIPPFLDTNLILRCITQNDPEQPSSAYQRFQQLEAGTLTLLLTEAVLVEVVQVLSSKRLYNLPRQEIRKHLSVIVGLRGLKLAHKRMYLRALDIYVANNRLDFVDALLVAHVERTKAGAIMSFDRDFDRISSVSRQEP